MASNTQKKDLAFSVAFAYLDEAINPNAAANAGVSQYEECMIVLFHTLKLYYPQTLRRLYVNKMPRDSFHGMLMQLDVKVIKVGFNFRPPSGFMDTFQASLFTLDVISNLEPNLDHCLLDPDVIATWNTQHLAGWAGHLQGYSTGFDLDEKANGLSLRNIVKYASTHGFQVLPTQYLGGELFMIPGSLVQPIAQALGKLWKDNLSLFESGKPYLKTEEHFLTLLLPQFQVKTPVGVVSRVWTTPSFRRVPKNWFELGFLHLPSEKGFGFSSAFEDIISRGNLGNSGESPYTKKYLSKTFHLSLIPPALWIARKLILLRTRILK